MKKIILTILAKDILLDNYMSENSCPITKALHRAGYLNLTDIGYIRGKDNDDEKVYIDNSSYNALLQKLYGMYNSLGKDYKHSATVIPPIPIEDFTHVIEY